jgi:hypothetical protein
MGTIPLRLPLQSGCLVSFEKCTGAPKTEVSISLDALL